MRATKGYVAGCLGCWLVLSMGCGDDSSTSSGPAVIVDRVAEREPPRGPGGDERFDEEGNLLESDVRVAGIILPRGMTEEPSVEREHSYSTRVSHEKVLQYIGPRLQTGEVDRYGDVVIYRNAVSRDARGAVVRMDVRVMPLHMGGTRLIITEYEPIPEEEPEDSDTLIRQFNEELRNLD